MYFSAQLDSADDTSDLHNTTPKKEKDTKTYNERPQDHGQSKTHKKHVEG